MGKFTITREQAIALSNLVSAYSQLSLVWDSSGGPNDWNGPEGLGALLVSEGLLPEVSLDEAGSYMLDVIDQCEVDL